MTARGYYSNNTFCYKAIVKEVKNRSTVILDVDLGFNIKVPNQKYKVLKINEHHYKSKPINAKYKVLRIIKPGDQVIIKSEYVNHRHYCEIITELTDPHLYFYKAVMGKIVDGDTVDAILDLGFSIEFKERFRLKGINAWETRGDERAKGLMAKARVIELAPTGSDIIVKTFKDAKGKYGRYLGSINIPGQNKNINDILVEEGHAVLYM